MGKGPLYYIETDGEVYLVEREGRLTFPDSVEGLPFPVEERHRFEALDREIVFCKPKLERHPTDWVYKDDVPVRRDVADVVKKAVNISIPRCVVALALSRGSGKDKEVLLVKSSRGVTAGKWNIPGGFLDFCEAPEEAARREAKEELGVDVEVRRLLGVYSQFFHGSTHHLFCFAYEVEAESKEFTPGEDEIADIAWMPVEEAIRRTENPFARQAFRALAGPGETALPKPDHNR